MILSLRAHLRTLGQAVVVYDVTVPHLWEICPQRC
jgi:hypothetical protein